jgi:hypothetical protein
MIITTPLAKSILKTLFNGFVLMVKELMGKIYLLQLVLLKLSFCE